MAGTPGIDLAASVSVEVGTYGKPWAGGAPYTDAGDMLSIESSVVVIKSEGGGVWAGGQSRAGYGIDCSTQAPVVLGSYAKQVLDPIQISSGGLFEVQPLAIPVVDGDDSILISFGGDVDFVSDVQSGAVPLAVQFTITEQTGLYNIPVVLWDFGDGNTSSELRPTHTYTTAGIYTVSLTIFTVDDEFSETKIDYITVRVLYGPSYRLGVDTIDMDSLFEDKIMGSDQGAGDVSFEDELMAEELEPQEDQIFLGEDEV